MLLLIKVTKMTKIPRKTVAMIATKRKRIVK
jgi:hypothetical protein